MNEETDKKQLPVMAHRTQIIEAVKRNQVTIIVGATGCGKTTKVPQFIFEDVAKDRKKFCRIVVTQPRRIAAIKIAERVAKERSSMLGRVVGYRVGNDRVLGDDVGIEFTTPGVLVNLLISWKKVGSYTHYVIDEIHARDLETDLLLILLRYLLVLDYNKHTKIILMSATLDPEKFRNYFYSWDDDECCPLGHAELIRINTEPKLTGTEFLKFDIKEIYLDRLYTFLDNEAFPNIRQTIAQLHQRSHEEPRIVKEMYEVCLAILLQLDNYESSKSEPKGAGGVLIFLPGIHEIDYMLKLCEKEVLDRDLKWKLFPLHSVLAREEQIMAFRSVDEDYRKIIFATNIAESSLTVKDMTYVIDFCLTKCRTLNLSLNALQMEWTSKNQCTQRKGRVGRVGNGTVFRLVTKQFYVQFPDDAKPEIYRISLESAILKFKELDRGIEPLNWIGIAPDPPPLRNILSSFAKLKLVGGLTIEYNGVPSLQNGHLTLLGRFMGKLPFEPTFSKLLALGYAFGVLEECIIIVAGMNGRNPFTRSFYNAMSIVEKKKKVAGPNIMSDPFAILRVYRLWLYKHMEPKMYFPHQFQQETSISVHTMKQMENVIQEIINRLKPMDIEVDQDRIEAREHNPELTFLLQIVLAGAFYPNYYFRTKEGEGKNAKVRIRTWLNGHKDKDIRIDRNSINYLTPSEIDAFPEAPQYLFACCIESGSSANDQVIVLRDTALLPNFPGILDLLGMLFCPSLKFQLSPNSTQITGYVAGLGVDGYQNKPLCETLDMQVTLETQFTIMDIFKINQIREILSTVMDGLHRGTLYSLDQRIIQGYYPMLLKLIKGLFLVRRPKMDKVRANRSMLKRIQLPQPESNIARETNKDVYPQHTYPPLYPI